MIEPSNNLDLADYPRLEHALISMCSRNRLEFKSVSKSHLGSLEASRLEQDLSRWSRSQIDTLMACKGSGDYLLKCPTGFIFSATDLLLSDALFGTDFLEAVEGLHTERAPGSPLDPTDPVPVSASKLSQAL